MGTYTDEEAKRYLKRLEEKYGSRFKRAMKAVEEGRVFRIKREYSKVDIWLVYGSKGKPYLVIPDKFCTCRDFYLNVLVRRKVDLCYHILAQKIALRIGKYKEIAIDPLEDYKFFGKIISEIMKRK
ncbi:MAG: hypothetical protein B6U69_01550 [Thermofilum sp. ex4484_15]|nr:MAG: hypothetical protein B6U69_01550 [Thermofilum sp. ex4484_15]